MSLTDMTATEIVDAIAGGRLRAVELAEALCQSIERQASLNAFIHFDADKFLAAARAADEKTASGAECGPLHGLPLAIKDNIDVLGFTTTAATPALADYRPAKQGPVVQALIDAGAIVMGKANMHEMAFSPGVKNPDDGSETVYGGFGNARNPYDTTRSPAGSSTGTGVAVGARMAPAGLGSDTGGSVRNPAAWCGISGLRPTAQRYPQDNVVPISWTRDTIGPMARSIADLALLDRVITGEPTHPTVDLKDLTLGIDRDFFCTDADPTILAVFDAEIARLADGGVRIVDVTIPGLEEMTVESGQPLALYEFIRSVPKYLSDGGAEVSFDQLIEQIAASGLGDTLRALHNENAVSEATYKNVMTEIRPRLQAAYADCFSANGLDALVFPATLIPPFTLANPGMRHHKGVDIPAFAASGHNVQPASIGGFPSLTVAGSLTSDGLPAALGFDGPMNSDGKLLAIGAAYEAIRPAMPPPG